MEAVSAELRAKASRVVEALAAAGLDAVRLTSAPALGWLLCGARTGVPLGGDPVLSAVVRRDGAVVVRTLRNEADRLVAEELPPGVVLDVVPWHASLTATGDDEVPEAALSAALRAARAALLPVELDRYRALGRDVAQALTAVATRLTPGDAEGSAAGRLAAALYERGAEPAVVLVAGASRAAVPHPLPTGAPLGARAMLVVTGRRHGLHVSATRWVRFRDAGPDVVARLQQVEADAWEATRPGRTLGEVLADVAAAYPRHGFGTVQTPAWLAHHQGGPTGYAGRDPKATPGSTDRVVAGQAFAWNPWVPGAKAEDTVVVGTRDGAGDGAGDGARVEVLSTDPAWPTTDVRGRARPADLDLT